MVFSDGYITAYNRVAKIKNNMIPFEKILVFRSL